MTRVSIPMVQGVQQGVDPEMLPVGGLTVVEGRWTREGALRSTRHIGHTDSVWDTSVSAIGSTPSAGSRVAFVGQVSEHPATLLGVGGRVLAKSVVDGERLVDVGTISDAIPAGAWDVISGLGITGFYGVAQCVLVSGHIVIAATMRSESSALITRCVVWDPVSEMQVYSVDVGGAYPRLVALGGSDEYVLVVHDTASTDVDVYIGTISALTASGPGLFAVHAIGDVVDADAGFGVVGKTSFVVAYRASATTYQIRHYDEDLTLVDTWVVTPGVTMSIRPSIRCVLIDGDNRTYLAWVSGTAGTGALHVVATDAPTSGAGVSSVVSHTIGYTPIGQVGLTQFSDEELGVWAAVSTSGGATAPSNTYVYSVSTTPTIGDTAQQRVVQGQRLVAHPEQYRGRPIVIAAEQHEDTLQHLHWTHPEHRRAGRGEVLWADSSANLGPSVHLARVVVGSDAMATRYAVVPVVVSEAGAPLGSQSTAARLLAYRTPETRASARRGVRSGFIAGGRLSQWDGASVSPVGWSTYPVVAALTAVTGTTLTADALYQYVAVYEWWDARAQVHRSAPSLPVEITPTGTDRDVEIDVLPPPELKSVDGDVWIRVYRTLADGTVFYLLPKAADMRVADDGGQTYVTIADTTSDTTLAEQAALYTQAGTRPAYAPPGHIFAARVGDRVWVGGLVDRREARVSAPVIPGEAPSWPLDVDYRIRLPEECTGIAELDGAVVLFTRRGIYTTTGPGPDGRGDGSLGELRRIPSQTGCTEWASVVEVPQGILFRGERGVHLLPRGWGQPQYVGGAVADYLRDYPEILDAAVVPGVDSETTARLIAHDGSGAVILAWSVEAQRWAVTDTGEDLVSLGVDVSTGAPLMAVARADLDEETVLVESDHTEGTWRVQTGEIRAGSWLCVRDLELRGTLTADTDPSVIEVEIYWRDPGAPAEQTVSYTWTLAETEGADMPVVLQLTLPVQQAASYRLNIFENHGGGAGFVLNEIALHVDPLPGSARNRSAWRA